MKSESPVLHAVAYPPTLLLAPFELAALNIVGHVVAMIMGLVAFDMSPFLWIVSVLICHLLLIGVGFREGHVVSILKATGMSKRSTRNIIKSGNVKYVP